MSISPIPGRTTAPIPAATMRRYLAEGARTNLCLQSNAFTTTWTETQANDTQTIGVLSPDGGLTGWAYVPSVDNSLHGLIQSFTKALSAITYSASIYAKPNGYDVIAFRIDGGGGDGLWCSFNVNTGVVVQAATAVGSGWTAGTARITPAGSGYYRCECSFTTDATAQLRFIPLVQNASGNPFTPVTFAGNGTSGAYIYGAQVELGSFASSYIATTTAAVTRNAEIDAYSTASNITAAAGYISLQFTPTHTPSGTIALWGTYVDASNYTAILHDATNLIFRKRIAGSNYDATIANAFVSGTTYKMAATWGAAGTSIALDGTLGTGHANTTAAQIAATMQFGADGNSLQQPFASVGAGYIGQRQLSASEMQAITS